MPTAGQNRLEWDRRIGEVKQNILRTKRDLQRNPNDRGATNRLTRQNLRLKEYGSARTRGIEFDKGTRRIEQKISRASVIAARQRGRERLKREQIIKERGIKEGIRIVELKPKFLTKRQATQLEEARRDKGIIFLKKQELGKDITETQAKALTARERRATEVIQKAEKIMGIKDSGAGFVLGEAAVPVKGEEAIQLAISKRLSKLNAIERKEEITRKDKLTGLSLAGEIGFLTSILRKGEIFGLAISSAVISNVKGVTQLPKIAKNLIDEIKEDKRNIIKIGKRIPAALREEGEMFIELYRISPTEAVGNIAGQLVFFSGTGKALKVVGKLGKVPAKAVKTALKGKKGTKIKLLGVHQVGAENKIITRIIFSKGDRQIGGAIGISTIRQGKVFTETVGKVGKVGRITKKIKEKGVFTGKELTVAKDKALKITKKIKIKPMKKPKKIKALTPEQRKRLLKKKKIAKQRRETRIRRTAVKRKKEFLTKSERARRAGIKRLEMQKAKKIVSQESFLKKKKAFLRESERARRAGIKRLAIQKVKALPKKLKKKKKKKVKELTAKELREITRKKALRDVKKPRKISPVTAKRIRSKKLRVATKRFAKRKKEFLTKSERARRAGIKRLEMQKAKKIVSQESLLKKKKAFLRESERARIKGIARLKIKKARETIGIPKRKPKEFIKISQNIESLFQVGVGTIAQAPKGKLLRTVVKFPTAQLKKVKAKGLTIKDFISTTRIFTKKDWSLVVGKIFSKKKDLTDFLGFMKATSKTPLDSFSIGKQKLFRQALKQVVGVATASTTKGKSIIPKLSPQAKNLIARGTGVTISKTKATFIKPVPIAKVKAIITKQKQIGVIQKKVRTKQVTLTKQSKAISSKQKVLVKQKPKTRQKQQQLAKQKQNLRQKQKLLTKQKEGLKQKQKLLQKQRQGLQQKHKLLTRQKLGDPERTRIIVKPTPTKIPVGLIKKKKKKKKKAIPMKGRYTAEIKRRGKWKPIGKSSTQGLAQIRGIQRAKRTLGASVRVKKDGKIIKLQTSKEFRRSKADPRVLVQKRRKVKGVGSRLGTKAEIQAIKKARRRKPIKRKPMKRRSPTKSRKTSPRRTTTKSPRTSPSRRTSPKRPTPRRTTKRKATPQQLKNLAKGRKKLAEMRAR